MTDPDLAPLYQWAVDYARAVDQGDKSGACERHEQIREALEIQEATAETTPDPLLVAAREFAEKGPSTPQDEVERLLRTALDPPVLVSAADFAGAPQPAPVLWRDPDPANGGHDGVDAVLSVGECAILSSAGGLGKSTFMLEVASAAAHAHRTGKGYGAACGLRVAAGPVVVVSYEDSPARIAARLAWQESGPVPGDIHLTPDPAPLWEADANHSGASNHGPRWDALWHAVRNVAARLVVIDPVSAALADVSTSETGPVRAFLRKLTEEAARAACGVLLIAHDTKAARNAVATGDDPGAGIVAGSAAWYDGARGVLALARCPVGDDRLLYCAKANYGRTGWGARLTERKGPAGAFRGLELVARLRGADLDAALKPPAKPKDGAGRKAKANGAGQPAADPIE